MLATGSLIPVVVAARIDAQQTAYFYVAWVIAGIVDMIGISMGMSLTVEGAFDASTLAVNSRRALRKMASILLPCAALLALFAPFWLGLFGPAYAAQFGNGPRAVGPGHRVQGADRTLSGCAESAEPDIAWWRSSRPPEPS